MFDSRNARLPLAALGRPLLASLAICVGAFAAAMTLPSDVSGAARYAASANAQPDSTIERAIDQPRARTDAAGLKLANLQPPFTPTDYEVLQRILGYAVAVAQLQASEAPPIDTAPPPAVEEIVPVPTPVAARPRAGAPQPAAPSPAPAAPAPPPPPPPAPVSSGLDTSPMNAFERALFDDTNRRRASAGLAPLRANASLVGLARIRSLDMARNSYFSHTSPVTGDTAFTLMDRYGVPYGWAGENLAKNNYPDAQAVAVADDALWNSPAHRDNILGANYTDMGVALAVDATGMKYFTILFTGN